MDHVVTIGIPPLNLAAWGVVNATLGQPVAAAPLAGITQND